MGCVAACLRFFYHHASPYFHRSVRVQPATKTSDKDAFARAAVPGAPSKPPIPKDRAALLPQSWEVPAPSLPKESVWYASERRALQSPRHPRKTRERAWKTVYCYVAATHADFAAEHEILSTQVFEQLRRWCEESKMQFIAINHHVGVGEMQTSDYLRTVMKEIERCSKDSPLFFVTLLSETLGWVPTESQISEAGLSKQLATACGCSMLEMEVLRGAFWPSNPNAIYMFRDAGFLQSLTKEQLSEYRDPLASQRLQFIKSKLKETAPEQIFHYNCTVHPETHSGRPSLIRIDPYFGQAIKEFIMNRLRKEFPVLGGESSLAAMQSQQQKQELEKYTSTPIVDVASTLPKIETYINSSDAQTPLLLVGEAGCGKSTLLAHCVSTFLLREKAAKSERRDNSTVTKATNSSHLLDSEKASWNNFLARISPQKRLPNLRSSNKSRRILVDEGNLMLKGGPSLASSAGMQCKASEEDDQEWSFSVNSPLPSSGSHSLAGHARSIFYHFVGSIPRSADLRHLLQRLSLIDGCCSRTQFKSLRSKSSVNSLARDIRHLLSRRGAKKLLLIIDGIDEIQDERPSHVLKWLPGQLSATVRVVLSLKPSSETRKILSSRDPPCQELMVGTLSLTISRHLISTKLNAHSLLSSSLVDILMGKLGICNPRYIDESVSHLAREENRTQHMQDVGESLKELARFIPDDIQKLYNYEIQQLEENENGRYLMAALCLLHCSHFGLQETELIELLSALSPLGYVGESDPTTAHPSSAWWHSQSSPQHARSSGNASPLGGSKQASPQFLRKTSPDVRPGELFTTVDGFLGVSRRHPSGRSEVSSSSPQHISQISFTDVGMAMGVDGAARSRGYYSPSYLEPQQASPSHSLALPGAIEPVILDNPQRLSPRTARDGISHSISYPSASDLQAALPPPTQTPEGSPNLSRVPLQHLALPLSRASPSVSLLSVEFTQTPRKPSSSSLQQQASDVEVEPDLVEISPSGSSEAKNPPTQRSPKPLVGLERVNILEHHLEATSRWNRMNSYQWARIFQCLRPYLRNIGRDGESRWALANSSVNKAVHKRYFVNPPTQTFPFSFCTSQTFFGADKDETLYTLVSQARRGSNQTEREQQRSHGSSPVGSSHSTAQLDRGSPSVDVGKRQDWWHARLAGYFAVSNNEDRRAEELPYHLAKIRDRGKLSHCLVHLPLFERLSEEETVMDLLHYWKLTGGYSGAASLYQHSLAALEISGASTQEMVRMMHRVARFLHQYGDSDAAQHLLVDAIQLEEDKLEGRVESMASLTLTMTELLSDLSQQQAEKLQPQDSLEPEYRLVKVAGHCVEFHRALASPEAGQNLARLLQTLSRHLLYYSSLGGSIVLSARSSLEQAREAALESVEIFKEVQEYPSMIESQLQLAATYYTNPDQAMEVVEESEQLCLHQYGYHSDTMLHILQRKAELSNQMEVDQHHRKWVELATTLYGENHPLSVAAKDVATRSSQIRTNTCHKGAGPIQHKLESDTDGTHAMVTTAEVTLENF